MAIALFSVERLALGQKKGTTREKKGEKKGTKERAREKRLLSVLSAAGLSLFLLLAGLQPRQDKKRARLVREEI